MTEDNTGDGKNSSSTSRTFNPENRPEEYNTMSLLSLSGFDEMKTLLTNTDHKFDRSRLPEGAVIKDRRIDTFFTMKTVLIKETVEKLRVKLPGEKSARWMYIPMPGEESRRPVGGTKASPELLQALAYETYVKRVSLGNLLQQLKDIGMRISKNTLRNWLKKGKRHLDRLIMELKKENPKRSYYMEQALSYFDHFKDGLFLYRKDGNYPIDNNLAERQVRPFTAMRKVIQHYGSDDGAEMIAVYLSVVSTVKLAGVSVWRFFGDFFEDVVTGGRKHLGHLRLSPA